MQDVVKAFDELILDSQYFVDCKDILQFFNQQLWKVKKKLFKVIENKSELLYYTKVNSDFPLWKNFLVIK